MLQFRLQKKLHAATGTMQLDVELSIPQGKLVCLYGKSGAGKTSILRMLAGLMPANTGRIEVNKTLWLDSKKKIIVPTQRRKIGFLFQDYALFPNMTVKENLLFALEKRHTNKSVIFELIETMELGALQNQYPKTLSGGQQQRVALARALVRQPDLLLLDEPLSALDYEMRHKLQTYILKIHKAYGLTTILVSHEPSEIQNMADEILHIDKGQLIGRTTPAAFFQKNKLHLEGEILKIDRLQKYILIRFGWNEIQLPISEKELTFLKIGDKLRLSSLPKF